MSVTVARIMLTSASHLQRTLIAIVGRMVAPRTRHLAVQMALVNATAPTRDARRPIRRAVEVGLANGAHELRESFHRPYNP